MCKKSEIMKNYLLIPILIHSFILFAQDPQMIIEKQSSDSLLFIPTLEQAINRGMQNAHLLKEQDLRIEIEAHRLKSTKSLWMDAIRVQGEAKYGSVDDVIIKEYNTGDVEGHYGSSSNTRYAAGVYINLSLFDVTNRKRSMRISKNELKLAELKKEAITKRLRELIIIKYNKLLLSQNLLKVKSKAKEASSLQVKMAEVEFKNGQINIYEFSRVIESDTKAQSEFESVKMDYALAYQLIMEIIGQ